MSVASCKDLKPQVHHFDSEKYRLLLVQVNLGSCESFFLGGNVCKFVFNEFQTVLIQRDIKSALCAMNLQYETAAVLTLDYNGSVLISF